MSFLDGKRIFLLEDEVLVSMMAGDILIELGADVVGPADSVPEALAIAKSETIDAALLDVNIDGERSDSVAAALHARGIPFVFCTGYDESGLGSDFAALVVTKPYTEDNIRQALSQILKPEPKEQRRPGVPLRQPAA